MRLTSMNPGGAVGGARRSEAGFTMVEIALSIAVVAFALVAIVGVLPTGLQVQRDNREESIINADAAYLMEAIRSGNDRLGRLSGTNDIGVYMVRLNFHDGSSEVLINQNEAAPIDGQRLLGLLAAPRSLDRVGVSNVVAWVRARNGSAIDRDPQAQELGFRYELISEVIPTQTFPANTISSLHSNDVARIRHLQHNLHDVRLTFRWPLYRDNPNAVQNARVGTKRRTFRSLVAGRLTSYPTNVSGREMAVFYFDPSVYESAPKP